MKKIFTLLLLLAMMMGKNAKAQWYAVPDTNFRNYLISLGYGAGFNNTLDSINSNAPVVLSAKKLSILLQLNPLKPIQSPYGIKAFKNLDSLWFGSARPFGDFIDELPDSLKYLNCSGGHIWGLNTILPNSLKTLICSNNPLIAAPSLPNHLEYLDISFCNSSLSQLPFFTNHLKYINISGNYFYQNPTFNIPNSLIELNCSNSSITNLPTLPNTLKILRCNNNSLSTLPKLPDSLKILECRNSSVACLPKLPNGLTTLNTSQTNISCIPNLPANLTATPNLPLCNINSICSSYWNITGYVYLDKDSSCTLNSTDTTLKNIKIELWHNGIKEQQTFSRADGSYGFYVFSYDTFEIKIDTNNLPYYLSCPNQQFLTSIISPIDTIDSNMNFAMQCKSLINNNYNANIISHLHRPGRLVHADIVFSSNNNYGFNCDANNGGKIKLFKNGPMKFIINGYYTLQPNVISNDSLIWNVSNFNSIANYISFNFQMDTNALLGQSVCYELIVVPNTPDANPNDDTLQMCFPIMNGYDPNVKTAQLNVNDSTINYTIQFQNTGNDTAINIIVRDTLSNQLDISSLQITGYSHQPVTQTFGNKIVFNFPQINLVDSATNDPLSHGFVSFNVKVLPTVTTNSIVPNQAAIYFDFNPAIYTNTTQTTICYQPSFATMNANICPVQSYTFNNHQLTTSGIYFDTLVNYVGCDSIIQLNLNVNNTKRDIYKTVCNGGSYFFNSKTRNASGIYKDTVLMGTGCDSLITLHLTVLPIIRKTKFTTICSSDSIYFNSKYRNQNGLYKDTLQSYLGCDSFATLILTVLPEIRTTLFKTSCSNQPVFFNNHLLNSTGRYEDTLQSYLGCDSFITMNFTYLTFSQTSLTQSICSNQSYTFKNKILTASGTYIDTLSNYLGCDSFVILHFTIKPISQTTLTQSVCSNQSFNFNNHTLTQSGTYYDTLQNYLGCDSFITLHFTIKPISQTTLTQSICSNQTFNFNNHNPTSSGTYFDTLTNYVGCDSLVILNFTYHLISNKVINQTICNNQTYLFKNQLLNSSGTYYDTLPNSNGCDSFITLHLTVLPISSSAINQTLCSGQSYSFNNHILTVGGTFKDTLTNYLGCDSVITLHLNILPVTSSSINQTICFGNSIVFNQQVCNQSGNYYDTLQNYLGCDSIIALHLTVLPFNHTFVQASFCQGSSYTFNGKTYTINGIYDDTLIAANGCDSAITLQLGMKIVDTSVLVTSNSLIATAGNSYFQWIDCGNNQNIAGANDSIFYPKSAGNYAVVVQSKQNLCTDTSACFHFGNIGMEQVSLSNGQLMIYPNPVKEELLVMSNKSLVNTIEVTDVLGRICISIKNHTSEIIHVEQLPSGIYFIKATDYKGHVLKAKFVKE